MKLNKSIITMALLLGEQLIAQTNSPVLTFDVADRLIAEDMKRGMALKQLNHELELAKIKNLQQEVEKNSLNLELEKDKLTKSFSQNDLIEKETLIKSKKLDFNLMEEEKRAEYLKKYPMTILGFEPKKADLINNIAEAELEKSKNQNESNSISKKFNGSLSANSNNLISVYNNELKIKEFLGISQNEINLNSKVSPSYVSNLKNLLNTNLNLINKISFTEEFISIYGEDIIKLRKNIFELKTKIDYFNIYNLKENSKILLLTEINNCNKILNENNSLINNILVKNQRNKTESYSSNFNKNGKTEKKKINLSSIYKNLKNNKLTLNEAKKELSINDNISKEQLLKNLKKELAKIEKANKKALYKKQLAIKKLKEEKELRKLENDKKQMEIEKAKIESEEKIRLSQIEAEKNAIANRIETEKLEKRRKLEEESEKFKSDYTVTGYYNGTVSLKDSENNKRKIYKNTKINNWTFVNWNELKREATFENEGKFITKKLILNDTGSVIEEIGKSTNDKNDKNNNKNNNKIGLTSK